MTEAARRPRPLHQLAVFGALAGLGVALLFGLGIWQLERLGWKLGLIATIDARVHAAATAAPGPAAWPGISADADEYRHVTASGHYLNDKETLVEAVTEKGPGFWVMTPFVTDAGFTVLVNRGFVPKERAVATRQASEIEGPAMVSGLLRITEPGGGFLRANDPQGNRWYSRDVAAIAKADHITAAPYFIDADATPNAGGYPIGGLTVIDLPNSHLVYALTWFVLAAMLAVGIGYVARDEWRLRHSRSVRAAVVRGSARGPRTSP